MSRLLSHLFLALAFLLGSLGPVFPGEDSGGSQPEAHAALAAKPATATPLPDTPTPSASPSPTADQASPTSENTPTPWESPPPPRDRLVD